MLLCANLPIARHQWVTLGIGLRLLPRRYPGKPAMAKALTAVSVEKVKASDRRQEIPDGLVPGLYLVLQPSGKRSWAVRYRKAGATRKLTLGAYPIVSLADARAAARLALGEVATGADPATQKVIARAIQSDPLRTFEVACRRYVTMLKKKGNRTWREPARQLGLVPPKRKRGEPASDDVEAFDLAKGGLVERWRLRPLDSITTDELIAELDAQAPVQANRFLNTLRTLWKFALSPRVKLSTTNPLEGLKRETPERSRDRVLSDDELRRVWDAAQDLGQPWTSLVRVLILSGQRRDEVARLPWSEIDLSDRKWLIPKERAKNGEPHIVYLSPAIVEELEALPRDGEYLFSRGTVPVGDFTQAKARLDELSGVSEWVFHDLRRTMATRLVELGEPANVVEGLLNHRSGTKAGIGGVYNRAQMEPQRYRASYSWARYVGFIVDEGAYQAWQRYLATVENEFDAKLEFFDTIRSGGASWAVWLDKLHGG